MQTSRSLTLLALSSLFAVAAWAQTAPPISPPASSPSSPSSPSLPLSAEAQAAFDARHREADRAAIHMHRLRHLDARLNTDPQVLQATCRYESEISTAPPQKHIALTFDDGPEPVQTEYILDILQRYQISATFFLIGEQAQRHPELVQKIVAAGRHQIGNHSWDHPNFHSIPAPEQSQEVEHSESALGADLVKKYFRYPYGNSTCETNALLRSQGYKIVGWHIDSCDWAFDKTGSVDAKEAATCGVLPQYRSDFTGHVLSALHAHGGGILLMHEIHPHTLRHLEEIIRTALAEGYVFDTVDSPEFEADMR